MRKLSVLLLCTLLCPVLLWGCTGQSADEYAGETITELKEGDPSAFSRLLDAGLEESGADFVIQCPEEVKEPYLKFLQAAFASIEFEVASASERSDDVYSVPITYTPIDLAQTVGSANEETAADPPSADFTETMLAVLEADTKLIADDPVYGTETTTDLTVSRTDDSFSIAEEDLQSFLASALSGYMTPYDTFGALYDMQDFLTSYLDASFKGEVAQFALHTDRTEDEAYEWYLADTFDPSADLSQAYVARYQAAMQNLLKQSSYTVGTPRLEPGLFSYQIDVTITPNNSLADAYHEFEQGTYYSIDEASEALVAALEKYAAAPTYGAETTLTVPVNMETLSTADQEGSDMATLATTILPSP